MTTAAHDTLTPESTPNSARARVTSASRSGVTFPRVIKSEWIKFWSVRSTIATLLSAVLIVPLVGMLMAAVATGDVSGTVDGSGPGDRFGGTSPLDSSLGAVGFAVLIVGVLGVLVGSREYATGQIRTTLQAVPRRIMALGAKAVVLASVVFGSMLVSVFAAFFAGQAILSAGGSDSVSITDDGSVQGLLGAAFYLAGVALIGLALGFLLRSTAGAIGTLVAALMIIPGIMGLLLPESWAGALDYLPSAAGDAFRGVATYTGELGAWAGLAVFLAWVVALMVGAGAVLKRRDA